MLNTKEEKNVLKKYSTDISSNLKYLLDIYSMNILELSKKSKVAYGAVYKLVNKAASPNLDTLVKISKVFNLNVSQLIGELPLTTSTENSFVTMVPIIEWHEVQQYLRNKFLNQKKPRFISISSAKQFSDTPFILIAGKETKTIFAKGTVLVFNKLDNPLENYDGQFVLVLVNKNNLPKLEKLCIKQDNAVLQPINDDSLNYVLQSSDHVLAHLVQIRVDS